MFFPAPALGEDGGGRRAQAEGVIQLPVRKQAAVGGDLGAVELELQATVEGDPKGRLFGFTRRIRHGRPVRPFLCC